MNINEQISESKPFTDDDMVIAELAKLSVLDYERERDDAAKKMGLKRTSILDKLVKDARKTLDVEADSGDELSEGIEPWGEHVDGQCIAQEVLDNFHRYTILPDSGDIALTLWTLGTYVYDGFRIFPKLCLSSPEKRCGKTTTLEVLGSVVHRSLVASNVSPSVIFRAVDLWHPSLLIDEADTFISSSDELRGIINSGHTKSAAYVLRVVGEDHIPTRFSTWAPMAIAMIKTPPDTIKDRSVMVTLRRKRPDERVKRLPIDIMADNQDLRRKCQRWSQDNMSNLIDVEPEIQDIGNSRAEDNWLPLIAIADLLGGEWPAVAREAMLTIENDKDDEEDNIGPMLLEDIKEVFEVSCETKITSHRMVERLVEMEERPWCEWKGGKPITQNSLARLLKPFKIKTKNSRQGHKITKAYDVSQFQDAFSRYINVISPDPLFQPLHRYKSTQPLIPKGYSVAVAKNQSATQPLHPTPTATFADGVRRENENVAVTGENGKQTATLEAPSSVGCRNVAVQSATQIQSATLQAPETLGCSGSEQNSGEGLDDTQVEGAL